MDLNAVLLNYGTLLEAGHSKFFWNSDGTLREKRLYADKAKTELIFTKQFFWNADGTLHHWHLVVWTTQEVVEKVFAWNSDGTLDEAETVA